MVYPLASGKRLQGRRFSEDTIATGLEEYPFLAVAACFAEGETILRIPKEIRKEMRARYKENVNGDRCRIAAAFRVSTKRDLQWVKSQERKEIYDNLKNNNWGDDMPF